MFDGTIEWRRRWKMEDIKWRMENGEWKTQDGRRKTEDNEEGLSMPGLGCWIPYVEVPADSPSDRIPYFMIIVVIP